MYRIVTKCQISELILITENALYFCLLYLRCKPGLFNARFNYLLKHKVTGQIGLRDMHKRMIIVISRNIDKVSGFPDIVLGIFVTFVTV